MKRARLLSVILAVALVAAIVPLPATAGSRARAAGVPSAPRTLAVASPAGVALTAAMPITGPMTMDVYRSTSKGVRGAKLTSSPVRGPYYLDRTADPGTEYRYTLVVSMRPAPDGASKERAANLAPVVRALPQVSAEIRALPDPAGAAKAAKVASPRPVSARTRYPASRASYSGPLPAAVTTVSGPTTITGNITWTTAASPYFIRGGDLVIASTGRLTIQPGVRVYFDVFDTGGTPGVDYETTSNPTRKCDLVVHGTLVANGTSASKILMSSVQGSIHGTDAAPYPRAGDWGSIFFDSRKASQISNARIEFGEGIWAKGTCRPYLISNTILNMHSTGYTERPWGAVHFEDPVADATTPRIQVRGNHISGPHNGLYFSWYPKSGNATLHPLVSGNTLGGMTALSMDIGGFDASATPGDYTVRGNVNSNTIVNHAADVQAVYLSAQATSTGSARIVTGFSGNTIRASSMIGITGAAMSPRGATACSPVWIGGSLSAVGFGMNLNAITSDNTSALTGAATVSPTVRSAALAGNQMSALYLSAVAGGAGAANCNPTLSAVKVSTGVGIAPLYAFADSGYGPASASPVLTSSTASAGFAGFGVYANAVCEHGAQSAKSNPRTTGGRLEGGLANVYAVSDSSAGSAEAKPALSGTTLASSGAVVFSMASSNTDSSTATGWADASPVLTDSRSTAGFMMGAGLVSMAVDSGHGKAIASPVLTRSPLTGSVGVGVQNIAASQYGSAAANARLTDSGVSTGSLALMSDATVVLPTAVGSAVVTPTAVRSGLASSMSSAANLSANNAGTGDAICSPSFTSRGLTGGAAGPIALTAAASADGTGQARVEPRLTSAPVSGGGGGIYMSAFAAGPRTPAALARVGGSLTSSLVKAGIGTGILASAESTDNVQVATAISGCTVQAPGGSGVIFTAMGHGAADRTVQNTATFTDCVISPALSDAVLLEAGDGSAVSTESVRCAPRLTRCTISSQMGRAVVVTAQHDGKGSARNDARVTRCPATSGQGISLMADAEAGEASNTAQVVGFRRTLVTATMGTAIDSMAESDLGDAFEKTRFEDLTLRPFIYGITSNAGIAGPPSGRLARNDALVRNVVVDNTNGLIVDGLNVQAAGSSRAHLAPTITGCSISGAGNNGIYAGVGGTAFNTATPVISSNTVSTPRLWGIVVDASGAGTDLEDDSSAAITANRVTNAYMNGLVMYGFATQNVLISRNQVTNAGFRNEAPGPTSVSGIHLDGADGGQVYGNLIRGCRVGLSLESPDGFPNITYNSFNDCTLGGGGFPTNLFSDSATPTIPAENNWWGYTASADISETIAHPATDAPSGVLVDFLPALGSCAPRLTSLIAAKVGNQVRFTLKFDRPMDTSIRRLTFGRTSPYRRYGVTGTWLGDKKTWKGTFTPRSILPTGVWMYFAGAKDLPGNAMASTSRRFRL